MDVARYNFVCQKALHQGLQYARSFGHEALEVEHVALALVRAEAASIDRAQSARLQRGLEAFLQKRRKVFGLVDIEFGRRLDRALDESEQAAGANLVSEANLWDKLSKQSECIQELLADAKAASSESSEGDADTFTKKSSELSRQDGLAASGPKSLSDKYAKILEELTVDLTAKAGRGGLEPVIGRDAETRRVIEILGRKKKNNPILIGEPGVGKSAIAELLAQRIAEGRVPESLKSKRVLSLDLTALVAGTRFRGEFEERLKDLLGAVDACEGQIILFIDEIHMLVGTGSSEGSTDASNVMKPALARGDLQCLGATTLDEYRAYIEKDAALERRFQPVRVLEPTKEATLAILRGLKSHYEIHHGVQIDDEALTAATDLSIKYLVGRRLPDKAIDLIDEACSRLRMQVESVPRVMDELRSRMDQLEIELKAIGDAESLKGERARIEVKVDWARSEYAKTEKCWREHQALLDRLRKEESQKRELQSLFEDAKSRGNFDLAAKLQYEEIPSVDSALEEVRLELDEMQHDHSWLRQVVGKIEVAGVVATWTGIPEERVMETQEVRLLDLASKMRERVFGQDAALDAVTQAIKRAFAGVADPNRPLGTFLFLGPTGVGKTETVKVLAREIFGDQGFLVRIDMSELMEQHSVARLIGSPPGYVGYGEGGELTEPVRQSPYSVVLLDEIEKAHPRVLDLLLQLFEDGRLTDGKGRVVNFTNTFVIMTSNLAGNESSPESMRDSLAGRLRPEFVGRIDEIVVFRGLEQAHLRRLLAKLASELNERLAHRQFRVVVGEQLSESLIDTAIKSNFGGRTLRRAFQASITNPVADRILHSPDRCKGVWVLELDPDGQLEWELEYAPQKYLMPAVS